MNFNQKLNLAIEGSSFVALLEAKLPLLSFQLDPKYKTPPKNVWIQDQRHWVDRQKTALRAALDELVEIFGQERPNIARISKIISEHIKDIITALNHEGIPIAVTAETFQQFLMDVSQMIYDDWEEFLIYADIPKDLPKSGN